MFQIITRAFAGVGAASVAYHGARYTYKAFKWVSTKFERPLKAEDMELAHLLGLEKVPSSTREYVVSLLGRDHDREFIIGISHSILDGQGEDSEVIEAETAAQLQTLYKLPKAPTTFGRFRFLMN